LSQNRARGGSSNEVHCAGDALNDALNDAPGVLSNPTLSAPCPKSHGIIIILHHAAEDFNHMGVQGALQLRLHEGGY